MSQRLSCLSTDFGLQLIRTIASFFSSVFVCQRYAAEDQLANSAAGLQKSNESGVECCRMHTTSSSTSSFASSISNSSRFFSSSSKLDKNNPRLAHIATPPTIVLTTPSGHRHRKSNQILLKSGQGSKSRLSKKNCFSSHLADFCNSHSDNDLSDSSLEDNDLDMELTARQQQMEKKLKATEKELSYLNHKIEKLLVKLEEEYETELAPSPDEECVICISAKATMQTFPCGHRVVCRKCFVKTIQMVVSQRMLPLRCVICRAKILRLKQTTTGGLSTGYVRSNSKQQALFSDGAHSQPSSLVSTSGASRMPICFPSATPTLSPVSPLTEVFQAQKTLYELQYRVVNPKGKPYSKMELEQDSFNGNLDQIDDFSPVGESSYDSSWDTSVRVSRRLQRYFVHCANNNSNANRQHLANKRHIESLRCVSCGSCPMTTINGMFHPSLVNSVGSSHHSCDWIDSPANEQAESQLGVESALECGEEATSTTSSTSQLMPLTAYLHRKGRHSRHLQHRRWHGLRQQPLSFPLLNSRQQLVQLPDRLLEQPIFQREQAIPQHSFIQVKNLGSGQRGHSLLGPINEEEEEDLQWGDIVEEQHSKLSTGQSPSHSHRLPPTSPIQHSLHSMKVVHSSNDPDRPTLSKYRSNHRHNQSSQRAQICKSRSENVLVFSNRYKRLNDCKIENNEEETVLTDPTSDTESDQKIRRKPKFDNLKENSKHCKTQLSSIITGTIQESFRMFRFFKLNSVFLNRERNN